MSEDWRTVFRFAATGLVLTGVSLVCLMIYQLTLNPERNWLAIVAVCLCPWLLLVGRFFYVVEQLTMRGLILALMFTAVMNCLLYAGIGATYVKMRHWREGTNTT